METLDQFLKTRYHKDIPSLFEAVYRKDATAVKNILLAILEETIKKYPNKPAKEDTQAEKDSRMIEMITIYFDMDYEDWLLIRDKTFTVKISAIDTDFYVADLLPTKDYTFLNELCFNIMHYVEPSPSPYTQQQILHALEEYKNGNYEFRISTLLKK